MASYEYDNRAAPEDRRNVIVRGQRYFFKSTTPCTTCSHDDRFMYVKQVLNDSSDVVLECPVCTTSNTTKSVLVKRAE